MPLRPISEYKTDGIAQENQFLKSIDYNSLVFVRISNSGTFGNNRKKSLLRLSIARLCVSGIACV